MKTKTFATALTLVIAVLASCQKMENVGYDSDSGFSKEPSEAKAVQLASQKPQILGIHFSCVPAHEEDGIYKDGKGPQAPSNCFLIKYNNGYKVVVFDGEELFPSVEQIENSPLLENIEDMSEEYNSAYYDGEQWLPAVAEDIFEEGRFCSLRYSSSAPTPRNVRDETLKKWKEAGIWLKAFTTRLDGYTVSVENGSLVVSCGEATLILE